MERNNFLHPGSDLSQQPLQSAVTPAASLANSAGLVAASASVTQGARLPQMTVRIADSIEIRTFDVEIAGMAMRVADKLLAFAKVKNASTPAAKIIEILARGTMYPKMVFPEKSDVRPRLEAQVGGIIKQGQPLVLAVPLGGAKVAVPLKTGGVQMPDDSERLMLANLAGLILAMRSAYARIYLLIVPDAPLHPEFGFDAGTISAYLNRMRTLVAMMGFDGMVYVADTASLIPGELYATIIEDGEYEVIQRARQDKDEARNLEDQARSLQYIVRSPRVPLDDAVRFYGALAYGTQGVPETLAREVTEFRAHVRRLTVRMAAVNAFGLREPIGLVRRAVKLTFDVSDFIRATVHPKPGEIRPLLRRASNLDSPGLLPMHGLAFRVTDMEGTVRWGMTFAIDARMNGWVAVYDERGQFHHFEASGVTAHK